MTALYNEESKINGLMKHVQAGGYNAMCFRPMAPIRVKICPECGSVNPLMGTTCINCNVSFLEHSELKHPPYIADQVENINPLEPYQAGFKTSYNLNNIIGESVGMEYARKLAQRFAESSANILLTGESGSGKELFAHAIHNQSRPSGPFMVLNCAAIPRNLIESELFGYDGGAFTGAKKNGSQGKFELAKGGTLFLDEIGDMPLETQAVLLRVLENKQVMRVGGKKYQPIDFRLIAATNKELRSMVKVGLFRLDLYYRLSVLTIKIPPLRQRGRDIIDLAEFFLKKHASSTREIPKIDLDTQLKLMNYDWPGNVRQLENAMIYALHVYQHDTILTEHLPDEVTGSSIDQHFDASQGIFKTEQIQAVEPAAKTIDTMKELEKNAILNAISKTGNSIARASDLLGVSKSTLYRKIRKLDLKKTAF